MKNAMHKFTVDASTKKFTVKISPDTLYGFFEHNTLGDDFSGGLWFELLPKGLKLIDFDGTSHLPREIAKALSANGVVLTNEFLWEN